MTRSGWNVFLHNPRFLVREHLEPDAFAGHRFVFASQQRDR